MKGTAMDARGTLDASFLGAAAYRQSVACQREHVPYASHARRLTRLHRAAQQRLDATHERGATDIVPHIRTSRLTP